MSRFLPGRSGNPGGRPANPIAKVARDYGQEALDTLVNLMRNGRSEKIQAMAAIAILDRGFGKPATLDSAGEGDLDGATVIRQHRVVFVKAQEVK